MNQNLNLVHVSNNGRLSIPAKQRKLIGLEDGGLVMMWVEDGEIRIRTAEKIMAGLQTEAKQVFAGSGFSVDQFLAERREDFETE